MLAKITQFSPLRDVDVSEVMSPYTTFDWAAKLAKLRFDSVDFLLDSKKIVDSFRTCIDNVTEFGCIIYVCKLLFQNNFQNPCIEFSQSNNVTHKLPR